VTISEIFGRERGSWLQQRCVNVHKSGVKDGSAGRGGRLASVINNIAIMDVLSLNGTAPVNTCIYPKQQ